MKKAFLATLLTFVALPVTAINPLPTASSQVEAKLEGMFNILAITRNQKGIPNDSKLTGNRKHGAIDTSAYFAATAFSKADNFEYGAKVVLQPTTQASESGAFEGSHIFLINENLGKVELGSGFDAGTQMRTTGLDVARGTGDGWGDAAYFHKNIYTSPSAYGFFLGSGSFKKKNVESSRKITYFTPLLGGFRFGISYIPDTGNLGSDSMSSSSHTKDKARIIDANGFKYTERVESKNAVSVGTSLEHNISEDVDVKLSATGEFGKAASQGQKQEIDAQGKLVDGAPVTTYKLSRMRTYNIGAILTYGNFSYGASYGDVRGFTSREVDGTRHRTRLYAAAAAYTQGPVGVSLSYLLTDTRKNKVDAITLGTDYKLAPGLVPYAEITYFKGRGHKLPVFNDPTKYTSKGTVALIGMKLKF